MEGDLRIVDDEVARSWGYEVIELKPQLLDA